MPIVFGDKKQYASTSFPAKFGGFKFTETAHIKDVMAYVRVMVNPDDQLSWHRALQHYDGVGPKLSQQMVDSIVTQKSAGVGMDLSQFSKKGFEQTRYDKLDSNTQQNLGSLQVEKPMDVLFEGVDPEIYKETKDISPNGINNINKGYIKLN